MTAAERLEAFLDKLNPPLRAAFLAAMNDIRSTAREKVIAAHLEAGRIDLALAALNLRPEFLAPFEEALRAAFLESGAFAMAMVPPLRDPFSGLRVELRFDGRNRRVEAYLAEQSSGLVTAILDDARDGIRAYLTDAQVSGRNPLETARDITGRVNKLTGRREGGIVGLTSQQMGYVSNMRAELGDPATMSGYFKRKRRDKRFDRTIAKAIREGKPLPRDVVNKIVSRYSDRLLALRGEVIARTEALRALNAAQYESILQTVDTGVVRPDQVRRKWRTAQDGKVRDSHGRMNGQTAGLRERFSNGLLYPGDPNAPASETAQCRCVTLMLFDLSPARRAA